MEPSFAATLFIVHSTYIAA